MGKTILVVDDEEDIVEFLQTLLEDNGYTVRSANNGVDAMKSIMEVRPDLIMLDLQMPEETGTGLFRRLHERKGLKDIPIIIASGMAGRNVAVSKSIPVLEKPLDEELVLREVSKALAQ